MDYITDPRNIEFHSVYESDGNGNVWVRDDIPTPEMEPGNPQSDGTFSEPEISAHAIESYGWDLLTGFTGQYSYNGPVMHDSETLSGGLWGHILDTPMLFSPQVAEYYPDHEGFDSEDDYQEYISAYGLDYEGWVVAYVETEN